MRRHVGKRVPGSQNNRRTRVERTSGSTI
jgi:hypothetical protein